MRKRKSPLMLLVEERRGKPIEELLKELCEQYTLVEEIAADLGIEPSTAYKWLMEFGFEKRWMKPEPTGERT